jgi:hypothetical protein
MSTWYATREQVRLSLDYEDTPRNTMLIDTAIESGARSIESSLSRFFYPTIAVRKFDWPPLPTAGNYPWRVWLDANEVLSVTTLTSGGVVIPSSGYLLEPYNYGPPYNRIDINLGTNSAFTSSATWQQSLSVAGVFGACQDTAPCGTLAAAISTVGATTCSVTDSSAIGVGTMLLADTERMSVTGRSMLTTGQTLQTPVTADKAVVTLAVTDGTKYFVDETVLLDAERMRIIDIAGNNLIVKRAWDGTVLASHAGSTIYAPRTLTITRGEWGTTAATHLISAPLYRHVPPGTVTELNIAEAANTVLQKTSGYARTTGEGENQRPASGAGLSDLRKRAVTELGRKARQRTV